MSVGADLLRPSKTNNSGKVRTMKEKLQKIRENAIAQIREAKNLNTLNEARVAILGKKGELTSVLKSMKDVAPEEGRPAGE